MKIKYFVLISLAILSSVSRVSAVYSMNNEKCKYEWKNAAIPVGATYRLPFNVKGLNQVSVSTSSEIFDTLKDVTNDSCVVRDELSSAYNLAENGLDIKAVAVPDRQRFPYATSGLYILKANNDSCRIAAKIVVVVSGPTCEFNDLDGGHGINQPFELKCTIKFSDSMGVHPLYPRLSWLRNGVEIETAQVMPVLLDDYVLGAELAIVLHRRVKATYTCEATFTAPEAYPVTYTVTNQPDFKETCIVDRQNDDEK